MTGVQTCALPIYNADNAGQAFDSALLFIGAAKEFLLRLEARND